MNFDYRKRLLYRIAEKVHYPKDYWGDSDPSRTWPNRGLYISEAEALDAIAKFKETHPKDTSYYYVAPITDEQGVTKYQVQRGTLFVKKASDTIKLWGKKLKKVYRR